MTLLQIGFAFVVQGQWPSLQSWERLYQWDSNHYGEIAERGYFSTLPVFSPGTQLTKFSFEKYTNVAFFPGYPLAARLFILSGITRNMALLITSALAACVFWTYVVLLGRRLGCAAWIIVLIAAIAAHPTAFTLVAAYSTSLFLAALLGMLWWMASPQRWSGIVAAAHGFVLSATHVFGLPLAVIPLLVGAVERRRVGFWSKHLIISAGTILGASAFFLYCKIAFGWALLYFARQRIGWDIAPDYLLLGNEKFWSMVVPQWSMDPNYPFNIVNPISVPLMFWFLVITSVASGWRMFCERTERALPLALLGSAWILFYLSMSALINAGWRSMVRYTFPIYVCTLLVLFWSLVPLQHSRKTMMMFAALGAMVIAVLFGVQWWAAKLFMYGGWIE